MQGMGGEEGGWFGISDGGGGGGGGALRVGIFFLGMKLEPPIPGYR